MHFKGLCVMFALRDRHFPCEEIKVNQGVGVEAGRGRGNKLPRDFGFHPLPSNRSLA